MEISKEIHKLFSLPARMSFALMLGSHSNNKYQAVHPVLCVFLATDRRVSSSLGPF